MHDLKRPQPARVTAGTCTANGCTAPSDAIVLFDGKDLSKWTGNGGDAKWAVKDGYFQATSGAGSIKTKDSYGSCQIHIEWMVPETCKCESQHGCNSGLFFMDRYELQILGSNPNETYVDGMAGAMYGQDFGRDCPRREGDLLRARSQASHWFARSRRSPVLPQCVAASVGKLREFARRLPRRS